MSGPEPEQLQVWAESRGLAWQSEQTLPTVTERLRLGVGVGERRASYLAVSESGIRTITGSIKKKPERQTLGVCEGRLPGGLNAVIGHHVHLTDEGPGRDDRYLAITDTVVFADLPLRARPVFHLEGRKAGGEMKAALTIGDTSQMKGPLDGVILAPRGKTDSGGLQWVSFPAESDERIRRIVSASTRFLEGLPWESVLVEYECGRLAVWVKNLPVTDAETLDGFCRFASALAEGLAEVDGSTARLEPEAPLPLPEPDERDRWVSAGADLIDWDEPPVSVVAAQERYKKDIKPHATRTGWKVYGIVGVLLFGFSLLVAAGSLGLSLVFHDYPKPIAILIAIVSVGVGALAANRVGLEAGQAAIDDKINAGGIPWGIEAFARGYAEHAGLTREDPEELRRRLAVPFRGRCQMAWQGDLDSGRRGHLSVWMDPTNTPQPPRFFLLATTAKTGGEQPSGYRVEEVDGLRLTWQEVTSIQRAIHRLDELRAVA